MNLEKKKQLAKRVLKVGKEKIIFLEPRLNEIKEAITKQDIRDLHREGAIIVKGKKGRKKSVKKKSRSRGNIRKKPNIEKREYMTLTRKIRKYLSELKKQGKISNEDFNTARKKTRNKEFKNMVHIKEYIGGLKK